MKRRLLFIAAGCAATAALMALQNPIFLAFYSAEAAAASWHELWLVVRNGLRLDLTVAGYVTAPVLLAVIASLWVDLPDRAWRRIAGVWLVAVAVVTSAIFAGDLALYRYWGFRIDGSVMIYLADPKNAMASVEAAEALRQTAIFAVWTAMMSWVYLSLLRLFDGSRTRWRLPWTGVLLLIGGVLFLAIRGGVGTSVANVSKVCFSKNMFLNHAAINPVFSLLSTLGGNDDFAAQYDFFPEERRAELFAEAMGPAPGSASADTVRLLRTQRPNVVLVIMESFSRSILDAEAEGQPVMPRMKELAARSVWFENLYANSFRTDRGQVAILSGFPAQTRISLMKYPTKAPALPSLARSLGREGSRTSFTYGGDLHFT
ncbi:MAG: sulfatase-like hydrolase/transferase, partial [Alistipes sp.]|nr:sulfatase-like hydrolase/transferase [Alistipes sp.]